MAAVAMPRKSPKKIRRKEALRIKLRMSKQPQHKKNN
jgi:hypothetical protein